MSSIQISPFELLIKPIAPVKKSPGEPPALKALKRTIIQGYFLTISNLEKKERELIISYVISAPETAAPDDATVTRILENKTFITYDIAGQNKDLAFRRVEEEENKYFRYKSDSFILPSLATVSVQLLPNAESIVGNPEVKLEVRGFCEIIADNGVTGELFLNPEIRGTFIPNELFTAGNDDLKNLE
jgi:hypothetical protein